MFKDRVIYMCEPRSEILAERIGVLLCKDDPNIHPTSLCHNCYCTRMKKKNAIEDGRQYTPSPKVFTWKAHSTNCPICDHFQNAYSEGRRKKQKRPGRPASISTRAANNHIHSIAPSSFFPLDASMAECDSASTNLLCHLLKAVGPSSTTNQPCMHELFV